MRRFSLPNPVSFFRSLSLKRRVGVLLALVLILGGGGVAYMRFVNAPPSLEETAAALNFAIKNKSLDELNKYVDFGALSLSVAKAILTAEGTQVADEAKLKELSEKVRVRILDIFKEGGQVGKKGEQSESAPVYPEGREGAIQRELDKYKTRLEAKNAPGPLLPPMVDEPRPPVLPDDLARQLAEKPLSVQAREGNFGILASSINNPKAGYEAPLKLLALDSANGWKVVGLSNAQELTARYLEALAKWRGRTIEAFRDENRLRSEVMSKHFHVLSCQAFMAKNLGEQADVPLVITLEGVNMGERGLMSAGMECHLQKKDGTIVASVPLNSARAVASGDSFTQRWQIELPNGLPETKALLAENKLYCSTALSAISLSDGRIVHLRPQSELDALLK